MFYYHTTNLGWQCPRCSRCYNPTVQSCSYCEPPKTYITTTEYPFGDYPYQVTYGTTTTTTSPNSQADQGTQGQAGNYSSEKKAQEGKR